MKKISSIILVWAVLLTLIVAVNAYAAGTNEQVRLFVVEKSKNPQNILVVYCMVNQRCEFQPIDDAGQDHLYDVYWLMNGTTYKRTHPLIKKLARKRFVAPDAPALTTDFEVMLSDLKELVHDLPSDRVRVDAYRAADGRCRIRALVQLGPSGGDRIMQIESIYSKDRTVLGIPVGIHYIELHGIDIQNREKLSVRFNRNKQVEFDDHHMSDGNTHR